MGVREVLYLVGAVTVASAVLVGIASAVDATVPQTLLVIDWLLVMAVVGGERFSIRLWREHRARQALPPAGRAMGRILVVGAGDAAEAIGKEMMKRYSLGCYLVGYVDDDLRKVGQTVHGVPVLGTIEDIPAVVDQGRIDEIIIAIPSASGETMRRIVAYCQESEVKFRTLPGLHQLIDGKVTISHIRDVEVEDLLRREPYKPDLRESGLYLQGSRILVTGAAGSIGSELCRQIAGFQPESLVLFDWNENGLYEMELEMRERFPALQMEVVVGDIKNKGKAQKMMDLFEPEVIFHAAAHKHVPLMEANVDEAVLNNILGTRVWVEAAAQYGVDRFVFVSTDKAVNPTSVMGATKRVAEMIIQSQMGRSETKFVAVRFGNVLGSRGSVVPLFRKQIAQGGPITVTDPEVMRYFMTVGEAARLIIQAAALGKRGEIFVLDMGQPVKIVDLARDMIKLSGLKEGEDIEIKFIGLRPGEKLFEEILTEMEGTTATRYEKVFLSRLEEVNRENLAQGIEELERLALSRDSKGVKSKLKKLVPSYHPEEQA
jgi:FlaA1/EpsC-like NDP-sugar epimerase